MCTSCAGALRPRLPTGGPFRPVLGQPRHENLVAQRHHHRAQKQAHHTGLMKNPMMIPARIVTSITSAVFPRFRTSFLTSAKFTQTHPPPGNSSITIFPVRIGGPESLRWPVGFSIREHPNENRAGEEGHRVAVNPHQNRRPQLRPFVVRVCLFISRSQKSLWLSQVLSSGLIDD